MSSRFEVAAEKLAWRCDLSYLPYTCTAEMTPLEDFIGQERAIRAIEFGLGVNKPGFNIFVTGLTGTGKTSIIKAFLKKAKAAQSSIGDGSRCSGGLVLRLQFHRRRSAGGAQDSSGVGQIAQDRYGAAGSESSACKPKRCSKATNTFTTAKGRSNRSRKNNKR